MAKNVVSAEKVGSTINFGDNLRVPWGIPDVAFRSNMYGTDDWRVVRYKATTETAVYGVPQFHYDSTLTGPMSFRQAWDEVRRVDVKTNRGSTLKQDFYLAVPHIDGNPIDPVEAYRIRAERGTCNITLEDSLAIRGLTEQDIRAGYEFLEEQKPVGTPMQTGPQTRDQTTADHDDVIGNYFRELDKPEALHERMFASNFDRGYKWGMEETQRKRTPDVIDQSREDWRFSETSSDHNIKGESTGRKVAYASRLIDSFLDSGKYYGASVGFLSTQNARRAFELLEGLDEQGRKLARGKIEDVISKHTEGNPDFKAYVMKGLREMGFDQ